MSGLSTQSAGGALTAATLATIKTLAACIMPSQGNMFFVNPRTGSDNDPGTIEQPLKTLARALALATPGQNDTIFLEAAANSAALTTDYQTTTLDWNKDLVHLIGVNSGPALSQRSRIAFQSAYATASNLFTLSANGCLIGNVEVFAGVAQAQPTGCMKVTGQRNHLVNCHIAGMGAAANDIAGAYSLKLDGAAENLFERCTVGVDTVTLGAAAGGNSVLLAANKATRNEFRNCQVLLYTNHATRSVFLRAPSGSLDRWLKFEDCQFLNPIDAASTNLDEAAVIAADAGGSVLLVGSKTGFVGATDWNSADSGNVRAINGTVTSATYGLGTAVTRA